MLISWTVVRIGNNLLNKLDDIRINGLPIIYYVLPIKTEGLNITSGYHGEYKMIIEFLYKGTIEFEYI